MKTFVVKRKFLLFMLCFALVSCSLLGVVFGAKLVFGKPALAKTIVIDAGHGGVDGGAEGEETDVNESTLNLIYAKKLAKICKEFGYKVVLTRKDENGLYDETAKSKKKSEMENRKKIIEKSNPDAVVSLHMNSFSDRRVRGAHVFYAEGNEAGKVLAEKVATCLSQNIEHAYKQTNAGDYFVLNSTKCAGILVECGFLSNPEEEKLLQQEDYIQRFCYYLFCGIYLFLR